MSWWKGGSYHGPLSFTLFALPYTAMYMNNVSRGLCVYAWMNMGKDKSAYESWWKGGSFHGPPIWHLCPSLMCPSSHSVQVWGGRSGEKIGSSGHWCGLSTNWPVGIILASRGMWVSFGHPKSQTLKNHSLGHPIYLWGISKSINVMH